MKDDALDELPFQIAGLISAHLVGDLSPQQRRELDAWIQADPANAHLLQRLQEQSRQPTANPLLRYDAIAGLQAIKEKVATKRKGRVYRQRVWWAAAAAIPLIVGLGLYLGQQKPDAPLEYGTNPMADIPPGSSQAILITGSDSLSLAAGKDTLLALGSGLSARQQQGTLHLSSTTATNTEAPFQTLITPKGGTYRIVLEDGTKAWLNAASSIRFPARFSRHDRTIAITGEVYLEIAADAIRPFRVLADEHTIDVLGTAFNVNTYSPGEAVATLVSGKIKVSAGTDQKLVQPGEQASISAGGINISPADVEQVLGWKNGRLIQRKARLEAVMADIARWYNIDVAYIKGTEHRSGITIDISREVPLGKVLEMLELSGAARFSRSGRVVKVMP